MPRLGSKKSRNGCQQCKARRVKCDENRPCGACMRYKVECSLLSHLGHVGLREAVSSASSLQQQHQQAFSETSSDAQYSHVHDYTPGAAEAATASASPDSTEHTPGRQAHAVPSPSASTSVLSWMSDLELMHHYTAYAHATIPGVDQARHVWGFTVPQEGFKHQFLMHSILAFSAYHLAHLQPSNTSHYRILASTHHTAAVTTINRKLAELDLTLDPNTSHALFAAASLIVINAFADAETHDLNAILDIFHLVRGMAFILHSSVDQLQKGPFAIILKDPDEPPKPPPVLSTYLIDLQILSCAPSTASPLQTNVAHAAEKLREALQHGIERSPHPAFRACIVWPINLDPEVLECVKAGRSDGSVKELWWQFCRLLEFCAGEWWFLRGWVGVAGRVSGER